MSTFSKTQPKSSGATFFYIAIFVAVFVIIILTPSLFPCFVAENLSSKFILIKRNTKLDVAKRYEPRFAVIKEKFASISRLLPPKGEATDYGSATNLDPKPIYDAKEEIYNTEIIKYEQLLNPMLRDYQVEPYYPYIHTDEPLMKYMSDADPNGDYMKWWGKDEPACGLEEEYEKVLNYKYLVVFRLLDYQRPTATDKEAISTGSVTAECFFTNLDNPKLIASFRINVVPIKTSQQKLLQIPEKKENVYFQQAAFLQYRYRPPISNPKTPKPYVPPPITPQQAMLNSLENELFREVEKTVMQKLRDITQSNFRQKYD